MKLISSREAVNFLAQAAPRPWVHRLLRWMAFDEGLTAYTSSGKVQPYSNVGSFTMQLFKEAGEFSGPKMDEAISREYPPEVAAGLVGKDHSERIDHEATTWASDGEPRAIDIGFFLYESELDFDDGILKCEKIPTNGELFDVFFNEDNEFISYEFEDAEYEIEMYGLSFEFSKIEMLLPSFQLRQSTGFFTERPERKLNVGRPPKWDWEGALAFVIAQAQQPDGLPTGPGAQARIEEMIAAWFDKETGDSPAPSQIRQRAAKIMNMLEKPKTPKSI